MNRFSRLAALALTATIAACGQNSPETAQPTDAATAASTSAPETKPGLSLTGGRLVLPAVKGNPAAAYFTLANGSARPVTVAAVDVAGAGMAMLHETVQTGGHSEMKMLDRPQVSAGGMLTLAPGGKHLMIDGVPAEWKPGASVDLTLTFADGDKLSAPLAVEGPGGIQ